MDGKSIKWDEVVTGCIPVFKSFIARGVIPTLRTIHYALVSKGIIPNTKSAYKGLSSALVKARQDGKVQWNWLADEGRTTEEGELGYVWDPENYAKATLERLVSEVSKGFRGASRFSYPKWMGQEYYVEVWIEKSALRATFSKYLTDFNVTLVPSRGYSSWTFLKEAYDRISEKAEGKTVVILYFGDFDPSGVDIERFLRDSMNGFFGLDLEVKRIGVTMEQVEEFNLPTTPEDAEEIEKLHRDVRFNTWTHGDYRVELDALLAFVPDDFERIVKESVENLFDRDVYDSVQEREAEARELISNILKAQLPEKIQAILDDAAEGKGEDEKENDN